jgi:hypothetical protein
VGLVLAAAVVALACGDSNGTPGPDAGGDSAGVPDATTTRDDGGRDATGSDGAGSDATGSDGSSTDANGSDGAGPGDAGDAGSCTTFPTFDKTCSVDGDCDYGLHRPPPCCSNYLAIGFAAGQKSAFTAAESSCDWPHCAAPGDSGGGIGCSDVATSAEDGKSIGGGIAGGTLAVQCKMGKCMTLVR